jgi:hypothetical protein
MNGRQIGLALILIAGVGVGGRASAQPPATKPNPLFKSELLDSIADDAPLPALWLNREEVLAFDRLILHARQMSPDVLRRAARRDRTFANLYGPERGKYRGELIHLDGRLRLLRRLDLPETLQGFGEGLDALFESWVVDPSADAFYCVVVSELPPNLTPAEAMDRPVECDAYFFKRYRYETRERDPQGGNVHRLAPLLIGRTIQPKADPAGGASLWAVPGAVLIGTLGLVGLSLTVAMAVVWWFRREDRQVRARLQQARPQTFAPDSATGDEAVVPEMPPVEPWESFGTSPSEN